MRHPERSRGNYRIPNQLKGNSSFARYAKEVPDSSFGRFRMTFKKVILQPKRYRFQSCALSVMRMRKSRDSGRKSPTQFHRGGYIREAVHLQTSQSALIRHLLQTSATGLSTPVNQQIYRPIRPIMHMHRKKFSARSIA